MEGKPFEVFAIIGKSGRSTTAKTEAIGRLVSLALRSGIEVGQIVEQLKASERSILSPSRAGWCFRCRMPSAGFWKRNICRKG